MKELIPLTPNGQSAVTMTSLELVEFINQFRRAQAEKAGQEFTELLHKNFLAKVPEVLDETSAKFLADLPDAYGRPRKGYIFPKREACLMAMSYSYELQAAVYDRMTALEEQARALTMPRTLAESLRLAADLAEKAERAALERDEAVRTKAEIGTRREATSMNTASQAVKKSNALEDKLGIGRNYRQVKAVEWLPEEFRPEKGMYSQVGKKVSELSDRMNYPPLLVPDERFPKGVKAYHVDVWDAFRAMLRTDLNLLGRYRRRPSLAQSAGHLSLVS